MTVFPVYYFPPISWFALAKAKKSIVLEAKQHFRKQHFHNRMRIQSANQIQVLSLPVKRSGENIPINEKLISFEEDWQKNHWKSLESAYRNAPYFEYYEAEVEPFFINQTDNLFEFNLAILKTLLPLLEMDLEWTVSEKYESAEFYDMDVREDFDRSGSKLPGWFHAEAYTQVFRNFEKDLSILDLLFNEGPRSGLILNKCILAE